ncbi:uncharacterized protein LOC144227886 [Crocuta crocuta]
MTRRKTKQNVKREFGFDRLDNSVGTVIVTQAYVTRKKLAWSEDSDSHCCARIASPLRPPRSRHRCSFPPLALNRKEVKETEKSWRLEAEILGPITLRSSLMRTNQGNREMAKDGRIQDRRIL